jgi:tRNA (guanine10-N2)-methyltransferase
MKSPFCIVRAQDNATVRAVTARSILTKDVYELWGQGQNYEEVHAEVRRRTEHRWQDFRDVSFRFDVDVFSWKRSSQEKNDLIQSFAYLGFEGQIRMRQPDEVFCILEDHFPEVQSDAAPQEISSLQGTEEIKRVYFGRWLDRGGREAMVKYDLKKRRYISTTSMDAELSLITANMAHAAPGKLFFDPFVGTGGFLVAAAHFGAMTLGADIDPRSFRGKQEITKDNPIGVFSNFNQYGIERHFIDCLSSDLTNSPLRDIPFLDGIVTDPPYGVREGLRVLGTRDGSKTEPIYIDGVPAHTCVSIFEEYDTLCSLILTDGPGS